VGIDAGNSFLAGVLSNTQELCAFGLANFDSYERVMGDYAGDWVGFGTGNRDLPVRKASQSHWEFRALDGTVKVYLYLAAMLLSGLQDMDSSLALTSQDCQVVPSGMSWWRSSPS
jgi:glutamine synthetase